MSTRRSQIDRAIAKVSGEIQILHQVLARLVAERDAKATKPPKTRGARPAPVAKVAGE